MAHLGHRLAAATGLNEEVFDALVLLAGGGLASAAVAWGGGEAAQWVERDMAVGRARLGFGSEEAGRLAELHARNFM